MPHKRIPRPRKPRPVRGRLPGQGAPGKQKTGPKHPWDRAEQAVDWVSGKINPFD